MPIRYKFDVLEALKEAGYSTYKIRKEKILSESTVQAFRRGELVALDNIGRVCELLQCQPGDILWNTPPIKSRSQAAYRRYLALPLERVGTRAERLCVPSRSLLSR